MTPGSVPILGLASAPILETKFPELVMSLLDFSPRIPLGTFSILPWRERVSVSIPCYGIRFSAVLYITNAPSIQMIQQLLGSPVVCQFYDMRFFVCETSFPPPPPCYTTSFWYIICYHNLHLSFEGSCVTRGEQHRIRKHWNSYIFTGWKIKFPHCGILTESCWNLKFTSSFRKDSAA